VVLVDAGLVSIRSLCNEILHSVECGAAQWRIRSAEKIFDLLPESRIALTVVGAPFCLLDPCDAMGVSRNEYAPLSHLHFLLKNSDKEQIA
jgi:hypothetical protein